MQSDFFMLNFRYLAIIMKKDQYFNLEVNLLNDDNIAVMMSELDAAEAIGIYMMLLLHLRTKDDYESSCQPFLLKAFARRYDVDPEILKRVLYEFNLFEVDEERKTFRSPYLDRVMKRLEEKWRLNAENGKKGGRPKKSVRSAETPAGKGQKPNETQERRVEENKGISSVVNNSSNTGAIPQVAAVGAGGGNGSSPVASAIVAAGVEICPSTPAITGGGMRIRPIDEESQRPLQPVESWENLVDQLAASESYMELAGQHSGLGRLFLDHRPQIIRLFKDHIRLYGKTAELLFLEDVRRYFSNYIAAGSTSCRVLREALVAGIREENDRNDGRFESRVDGQRTYLGHPIPNDAPPRPDASAVWDDVKKKWGH